MFPPNRDLLEVGLGPTTGATWASYVRSGEDRERELRQFGREPPPGHWEAQDGLHNGPALGKPGALQHGAATQSRRPREDFGTVGGCARHLFEWKELADPVYNWKLLPNIAER